MNSSQSTLSPLQQSAAFEFAFRLRQPQPARPKACVVLLHGVGGAETNLADKRKPYLLPQGEKGPNHSQATLTALLAACAPASGTPARLPAGAAPVSGRQSTLDTAPDGPRR